jgi:hypothetical protein
MNRLRANFYPYCLCLVISHLCIEQTSESAYEVSDLRLCPPLSPSFRTIQARREQNGGGDARQFSFVVRRFPIVRANLRLSFTFRHLSSILAIHFDNQLSTTTGTTTKDEDDLRLEGR